MLMPILMWVGIVAAMVVVGWITYKIAAKVDREEQVLHEWETYCAYLQRSDPQKAEQLQWLQQYGDDTQYAAWVWQQQQQLWQQQQQQQQWGERRW